MAEPRPFPRLTGLGCRVRPIRLRALCERYTVALAKAAAPRPKLAPAPAPANFTLAKEPCRG